MSKLLPSKRDRHSMFSMVTFLAAIALLSSMKYGNKNKFDQGQIEEFKERSKQYLDEYQSLPENRSNAPTMTNNSKMSASEKITKSTSDYVEKNEKNSSKRYENESIRTSKKAISKNELNLSPSKKSYTHYYRKTIKELDVNASDVSDWEALPGIGPYYAKIITNFRDKLGGFTQIEQVGETWRLPDSTFQKVKPYLRLSPLKHQIDINTANEERLKSHPYIDWRQAKLIVNYRAQHGQYIELSELKNILAFDSVWIEKIIPYLKTSLPKPEIEIVQNR